jgi:signal transduction histidine kinase
VDNGLGISSIQAEDGQAPGHGLRGMRERVALHNGTLEAGPLPAGGFQVLAWLPYASSPNPYDKTGRFQP